jgi:hypothetical protein
LLTDLPSPSRFRLSETPPSLPLIRGGISTHFYKGDRPLLSI